MKPILRPAPMSRHAMLLALLLTWTVAAQEAGQDQGLYGQITALQQQLHIQISGLENLEDSPRHRASGSPEQQLEQLLTPYNHLVQRNSQGKLTRLTILGKKQPQAATRLALPIRREGAHLLAKLLLSGDGRLWQNAELIIDTGADLLVLPDSLLAGLGVDASTLTLQTLQTANGAITARVGQLQAVKIAGETLENIDVAFLPNQRLGNLGLLGMSVLGRFQLNIDEQSQVLMLLHK